MQLDEEARNALMEMARSLDEARTLRVDVHQSFRSVRPGVKSEHEWDYTICVQRPDKLAMLLKNPAPMAGTVVTNGVTLHVYYPDEPRRYMTRKAPVSLDELKGQLVFADTFYPLFLSHADRALLTDVDRVIYVGKEVLPGLKIEARHIRLMYKNRRTDLWVKAEQGALPLRIQIAPWPVPQPGDLDSDEVVLFSNWEVDPVLPPTCFEFVPPEGVEIIKH